MQYLSTQTEQFQQELQTLIQWDEALDKKAQAIVEAIIMRVQNEGDGALVALTNELDHFKVSDASELVAMPEEFDASLKKISASLRGALQESAKRIREYHEKQLATSWEYEKDGVTLGQKVTPLNRVGVYVPGGKASYPSSVLMNVIPAKVAGVKEIIMVCPTPHGERNHLVLAAAAIAGVDKVIHVGGAQAVAALAYGTETVPKVDKIVGPGNQFVALAKKQVFGQVGIDMIAGPSEIVVVCDGQTEVDWIVMDLFSQAEHDEKAQSILISPDDAFLQRVKERIDEVLDQMTRKEIIESSLTSRGALIHVRDLNEACDVVNQIAPEHLELSVDNPRQLLEKIDHAGAVFLGRYTAEALGDYCAGPNHVLPTSGTARFASPLGVYDFQKRSSIIECDAHAAAILGETAALLSEGEGLQAHMLSAKLRT